jgi:hypothetical protein
MIMRHVAFQQESRDLPQPARVVPFGNYGGGLWTSHPIGLFIAVGLLAMGIIGLPEARWFLALAVPSGIICGVLMWLLYRDSLAAH